MCHPLPGFMEASEGPPQYSNSILNCQAQGPLFYFTGQQISQKQPMLLQSHYSFKSDPATKEQADFASQCTNRDLAPVRAITRGPVPFAGRATQVKQLTHRPASGCPFVRRPNHIDLYLLQITCCCRPAPLPGVLLVTRSRRACT